MSLERPKIEKNKSEKLAFMEEKLLACGLTKESLANYQNLINKVSFKNIDLSSESGMIHVDMLAALLMKQENGEVFFQNILDSINKDIESVENILIVSAKEIEAESIDLDIGSNRRVDRFSCLFANGDKYEFTLSADLEKNLHDADSNSFVEKEIFSKEIGTDNPWLQKYFGYIKKEIKEFSRHLIAKEYLPGKNIVQYFNEMPAAELSVPDYIDVACETAYTMGGLYQRMDGQLLDDLKLENIIYNHENPDDSRPACRVCDHAGYYDNDGEKRSALQIMAHLNSFMTLYYSKASTTDPEDLRLGTIAIIDSYLEAFCGEIDKNLVNKFVKNIDELRKSLASERQWEISDDLLDYVLNYDFQS